LARKVGQSYRSSIVQRRYVEPIADAKTQDTRSRRIAKVVADLKAGKK
jgi:uncharacterized protein YdeI (YjbR/CyaY-like superfamily)